MTSLTTNNISLERLGKPVLEDGSSSSSLVGRSCFAPIFKFRIAVSRSSAGLAFTAWALCKIEVALLILPLKRKG